MKSTREIAFEQAAVAILTEARNAGVDLHVLVEKAQVGLLGNATYRWVKDEHLDDSIGVLYEIAARIAH